MMKIQWINRILCPIFLVYKKLLVPMKTITVLLLLILCLPWASAYQRGIYLTQSTVENLNKLTYLINRSKQVGINTFIVDYKRPSKRYSKNIQ